MSLRSKILLVLCVVVALNAVADYAVQRTMVESSFVSLERQEASNDVHRVVEFLEAELEDLADQSRRWGAWRPTWEFVAGERDGYPEENLLDGALENAGLDLAYFCDTERRVVWGSAEIADRATGERRPARVKSFQLDALPRVPLFLELEVAQAEEREVTARDQTTGVLLTEEGPLLVSVAPILPGAGGGELRGTVILGRFLNEGLVASIGERANLSLACWNLEAGELPVDQEFLDLVTSEAPRPVVEPRDDELLDVWTTFPDLRRLPALLLRAEVPREILAEGRSSVNYALLSTLGTALAILFVLYRLLQRIVIGPLARLTAHAVEIGRTDDTSRRAGMEDRGDEIGTLSSEFDGMLDKLAEARAAHAETARMVGMSEIATGVLHNVGNVLNSVNVSANLVRTGVEKLSLDDLVAMKGILEENQDDLGRFVTEDPRGKHLLPFLDELTGSIVTQRETILDEVRSLGTGVEHIIELVRSQQSYAGMTGLFERAQIDKLLEQGLKITQQALAGRDDVEIVRDYEELGDFLIDRRKVTEIFVNVIQNARRAMDDAGGTKRLRFSVRRSGEFARIEIADSGEGIDPENLTKIFNHGFTTKKDGHGFGLHSCANAATEMGGRLWAESEGAGHGAIFLLEIPLAPRTERIAA